MPLTTLRVPLKNPLHLRSIPCAERPSRTRCHGFSISTRFPLSRLSSSRVSLLAPRVFILPSSASLAFDRAGSVDRLKIIRRGKRSRKIYGDNNAERVLGCSLFPTFFVSSYEALLPRGVMICEISPSVRLTFASFPKSASFIKCMN